MTMYFYGWETEQDYKKTYDCSRYIVNNDFNKENNISAKGDTRILQVLGDGIALATIFEKNNLTVVLIIGNIEEYFYDDQKIEIPNNKTIKQIGIYKYTTAKGYDKTVPAVVIQ